MKKKKKKKNPNYLKIKGNFEAKFNKKTNLV